MMADGRRERAPHAVTSSKAREELARLERSGEMDTGRVFPPRLCVEVVGADGTKTIKPLGASGRVLNLRQRITRRLRKMCDTWQVRWKPAFRSMGQEEVERAMADHGLEREGEEETLECLQERLEMEWLFQMSDRSKPVQEGGACSAGCDECEMRACCSHCAKSRAVWACACGKPDVLRCVRCARMGRVANRDVLDALAELDVQPVDGQWYQLGQLIRIERMH